MHEPMLTRLLDCRRDVGHDTAVELDVIRHLAACNDVGGLLLGIAKYYRVAPRHHDLCGIVVDDAVTDQHGLIAVDACFLSLELESVSLCVEHRYVTLIPGRAVAGTRHEDPHDRIGLVPLDQLLLPGGIGGGAVAARRIRARPNGVAPRRGERPDLGPKISVRRKSNRTRGEQDGAAHHAGAPALRELAESSASRLACRF